MKNINQTQNFCTSIQGRTIPKNAIYGYFKEYSIYYYIPYAFACTPKKISIVVYNPDNDRWEKSTIARYPKLRELVFRFMRNNNIKELHTDLPGLFKQVSHDSVKMRRAQVYNQSCGCQRRVDGKFLYADDRELKFNKSRDGMKIDFIKACQKKNYVVL